METTVHLCPTAPPDPSSLALGRKKISGFPAYFDDLFVRELGRNEPANNKPSDRAATGALRRDTRYVFNTLLHQHTCRRIFVSTCGNVLNI